MRNYVRTALAVGAVAASIGVPWARDLDPEMKQYVLVSCSDDAYRLCPQSLGNERDAVTCMKSKRAQLNQVCRVAYDKVVHLLSQ